MDRSSLDEVRLYLTMQPGTRIGMSARRVEQRWGDGIFEQGKGEMGERSSWDGMGLAMALLAKS